MLPDKPSFVPFCDGFLRTSTTTLSERAVVIRALAKNLSVRTDSIDI